MNLSLKIAKQILSQDLITYQDLGFYLTVIRDNCHDEDTIIQLHSLIINLSKVSF